MAVKLCLTNFLGETSQFSGKCYYFKASSLHGQIDKHHIEIHETLRFEIHVGRVHFIFCGWIFKKGLIDASDYVTLKVHNLILRKLFS